VLFRSLPIDVGFLRDDPVVNANGVRLDRPPPGGATEDPPLVLRFDGRKWEPLVREPMPGGLRGPEPRAHESRSVHLLGDAKGTLWLANEYLYRIRRYSPSGRLLLELTLGPQKLEARKDAGKAQESFAMETRDRARTSGGTATVRASTSRRTILALTEGRDGRLYLLAQESQGPDGLSLDRFDPLLLRMERAPLVLEADGYLSMAAGQDALYFAAFSAEAGPWKLDWSEIEAADWKELDGLRIDPHQG
jgi:hypothetical protein